jgi:hypothetical protein
VTPRVRLLVAFLLPAVAAAALVTSCGGREPEAEQSSPPLAKLPSLDGATGWLNGGPLTGDSIAGRPVVLFIWSDTDPRSLERLPMIQGWHDAYARYGVRIVGVHAPDYSFGTDSSVARGVARRLGLTFPIALDPGYRIRKGLGAREDHPRVIVAEASGEIVLDAGADRMAEADQSIREEVRRLHPDIGFPASPRATAEVVRTPRFVYLGTSHVRTGPLADVQPGRTLTYAAQFRYQSEGAPYVPFPVGRWTPTAEGVVAARGGASNYLAIRSEGGRVAAVIGPPTSGSTRVWILGDEEWLDADSRGDDVQSDSRGATYIEVTEPRLYWVATGKGRVLKLSPEKPDVTFYSFAFEPAAAASGMPAQGAASGGP